MSTTREYQALLVIQPDLNEDGTNKVQKQFGELITRYNGQVSDTAVLGKRKLSFKIGKWNEGDYVQMKVQLVPGEITKITKAAQQLEGLLRLMIIQGEVPAAINSFRPENAAEQPEAEQ